MIRRGRLRIGEVVEIELPIGFLYAQAVNYHRELFGTLVRVPTQLYQKRPDLFEDQSSIAYFCALHVPLQYDYPAVTFRSIGVFDVPEPWRPFPVFKTHYVDEEGHEVWLLWDGKRQERAPDGLSNDELKTYPTLEVGTPYTLIDDVLGLVAAEVTDATLNDWLGFRDDDRREGTAHFLYFANEKAAEQASQRLRQFGEVRCSRDDEQIAVVVEVPKDDDVPLGDRESQFGALAEEFGGVYDGWETPVG